MRGLGLSGANCFVVGFVRGIVKKLYDNRIECENKVSVYDSTTIERKKRKRKS